MVTSDKVVVVRVVGEGLLVTSDGHASEGVVVGEQEALVPVVPRTLLDVGWVGGEIPCADYAHYPFVVSRGAHVVAHVTESNLHGDVADWAVPSCGS